MHLKRLNCTEKHDSKKRDVPKTYVAKIVANKWVLGIITGKNLRAHQASSEFIKRTEDSISPKWWE